MVQRVKNSEISANPQLLITSVSAQTDTGLAPLQFTSAEKGTSATPAQNADPEHPVVDAPAVEASKIETPKALTGFLKNSDDIEKASEDVQKQVITSYVTSQYKELTSEEVNAKVEQLFNEEKEANKRLHSEMQTLSVVCKYDALQKNNVKIEDFNNLSKEQRRSMVAQYGLSAIMSYCDRLIPASAKEAMNWESLDGYQKLSKYADAFLSQVDPKYQGLKTEQEKQAYIDHTVSSLIEPNIPNFGKLDNSAKAFMIENIVVTSKALKYAGISMKSYVAMDAYDKNKILKDYFKAQNVKVNNTMLAYNVEIQEYAIANNGKYPSPAELKSFIINKGELNEDQQKLIDFCDMEIKAGVDKTNFIKTNEQLSAENGFTSVIDYNNAQLENAFKSGDSEKIAEKTINLMLGSLEDASSANQQEALRKKFAEFSEKYGINIDWDKMIEGPLRENPVYRSRVSQHISISAVDGDAGGVANGIHFSHKHKMKVNSNPAIHYYMCNSDNLEGATIVQTAAYSYADTYRAATDGFKLNNNFTYPQKAQSTAFALSSPSVPDSNKATVSSYVIQIYNDNPQAQLEMGSALAATKNVYVVEGLAAAKQYVNQSVINEYTSFVQTAINTSGFSNEEVARLNTALETGKISTETLSKTDSSSSSTEQSSNIQSGRTQGTASGAVPTTSTAQGQPSAQGVQNPQAVNNPQAVQNATAQVSANTQIRAAAAQESYFELTRKALALLDNMTEYETEKAKRNTERNKKIIDNYAKADKAAAESKKKEKLERDRRIASITQSDEQARTGELSTEQAIVEAKAHAGYYDEESQPVDPVYMRLKEAYQTGGIEKFYNELFNVAGRSNVLSTINRNANYRNKFIEHNKNNVALMREFLGYCATDEEKLSILRRMPTGVASQLITEIGLNPSALADAVSNGTLSTSRAYDILMAYRNSSDFSIYFNALKAYLPLEVQNELTAMINGSNSRYTNSGSQGGGSNNRRATGIDYENLRQYYGTV